MKRISPEQYIFAAGKIRVLEKFLIRREIFEEAINSGLDEALRLFVESDLYSDELLHVKNSQDVEAVLNQELSQLKKMVKSLVLDEKLFMAIDSNDLTCTENVIKSYRNQFLQDYFKFVIDMHNIKTFLRLYLLKEQEEKLRQKIVCEGFIKKTDFFRLYGQEITFFLKRLEFVHNGNQIMDYGENFKEAIEKLLKDNSFVALEKAITDFLIQVLKKAKYISYGPEPVLAYYFARINEINLMRMIILAKINGMSPDIVKERLNDVYA